MSFLARLAASQSSSRPITALSRGAGATGSGRINSAPTRSLSLSLKLFSEAHPSLGTGKSQSQWPFGLAALTALLAAGTTGLYFGTRRSENVASEAKKLSVPAKIDYQKVYNAIASNLEHDAEEYDDGSYGPVLVRLAWHCSGTFDKATNNGGSNGATMRFAPESNHGANAGLLYAREKLEPIKAQFPQISYSDLWTLAGVVAIQEMGGPQIPWRPGRQDGLVENCTPDGRLPDADKGASHLRSIFNRMGFDDQEIVALSGAHALGRCHTDRSGFEGPWTHSPITFSNEYFRLLWEEKWSKRKWAGPFQYQDQSTKSLMMLPTDMALITDKSFKSWVEKYAKSQDKFFEDFSKAFQKLVELGVPARNFEGVTPLLLRPTGDS